MIMGDLFITLVTVANGTELAALDIECTHRVMSISGQCASINNLLITCSVELSLNSTEEQVVRDRQI